MATNKPRIPVTMEPELFERVTQYRRQHGISSQSKAIQQLVKIGIRSLEGGAPPEPLSGKLEIRSPEDGKGPEPLSAGVPDTRDAQERELLRIARELDPAQKAVLLRLLEIAGGNEGTRRTR